MAKKTKKQTRNVSGSGMASQTSSSASMAAASSTNQTSRYSGPEFNPDYSTTIKDLKRIGVLATTFIGFLVIISFFLR